MNYGTFTGFTLTEGRRTWPKAIADLIPKKCRTMDHPSLDGTGWICWDDDEVVSHENITSVASNHADGEKVWRQRVNDENQERLDSDKISGEYSRDFSLEIDEIRIPQDDFVIGIDDQQTAINIEQVFIDAM